jgi:hypothetical protein
LASVLNRSIGLLACRLAEGTRAFFGFHYASVRRFASPGDQLTPWSRMGGNRPAALPAASLLVPVALSGAPRLPILFRWRRSHRQFTLRRERKHFWHRVRGRSVGWGRSLGDHAITGIASPSRK